MFQTGFCTNKLLSFQYLRVRTVVLQQFSLKQFWSNKNKLSIAKHNPDFISPNCPETTISGEYAKKVLCPFYIYAWNCRILMVFWRLNPARLSQSWLVYDVRILMSMAKQNPDNIFHSLFFSDFKVSVIQSPDTGSRRIFTMHIIYLPQPTHPAAINESWEAFEW